MCCEKFLWYKGGLNKKEIQLNLFSIFIFNEFYLSVTFMKYLASVVSLMFLSKTWIWHKIALLAWNSLHFAELVKNELMKSMFKKNLQIFFSIQFIAAYCKNLNNFTKILTSIVFYWSWTTNLWTWWQMRNRKSLKGL